MFDAIGSFGWMFAGMATFILASVGTGLLIRNARERRYLAVDAVNPSSEE